MDSQNTICVPLKYATFEEVVNAARKAEKEGASSVEIWLDHLPFTYGESRKDQKLLDELFTLIDLPIVCVNKGEVERGVFRGTESDRVNLLCKAALAGVDFLDIGIDTDEKLIEELKDTIEENGNVTQLIVSYHNFGGTPSFEDLKGVVKKSKALGADVIKIATMAKDDSDNDIIFKVLDFISKEGKKGIGICMGDRGTRSRRSGCSNGSLWTYAALDASSATASGQLTIKELNE